MHPPISWPHAPSHRLAASGTYFVTAATYQKSHFFHTPQRMDVLQRGLLSVLDESSWQLEAWAIFPNHYHFVAHTPLEGAKALPKMLGKLHTKTAIWLNRLDRTPKRPVWHNYWETYLDITGSYLARLNYVHQNAVHHGIVSVANSYPWCSAAWFERVGTPAQVKSIYSMKTDRLNVDDAYEVAPVEGV
jgi:putative transposase